MNDKTDINFNLIKQMFLEFVNNKTYMFSLLIMAILSYGFYLINISIGIDDLSISNYVKEPYALASGRYTFVLIGWILGYFSFTPFWIEFFSLIVLIISLILINVLFKISSNSKLPNNSYILFSIMFLSYSIISESLMYQMNAIFLAFGYLFTTISIIYTYKFIFDKDEKSIYFAIIFFALALGLYETFLSVYLILIIIVVILRLYYSNICFKKYCFNVVTIILLSLFLKLFLQYNLNFYKIPNLTSQNIYWFIYSIQDMLKMFFKSFFVNIIYQGVTNLSFSILLISFITYIILSINIRNKKITFLFTSLFISCFIIQIIMGLFYLNRTLNSLSVYVSFSFCLLYAITKSNKMRKIIFIFVIYLCLLSSKNINNELYKDLKRYNYEKYIVNQTAFMINNEFGYTEKPVVFLGRVNEPFTNNYNSEIGESSISWSIGAFYNGMEETQKLFLEQGHKFNLPTLQQINKAIEIYESMPRFPQQGSVKLINDEFIIVRY